MKGFKWQNGVRRLKAHTAFSWLMYLAIAGIMYVAMINTAMPTRLNVSLHQIATVDIQSPIEVVDDVATKAKRDQASADTPTSYVYQKDLGMIQVEKAGDIFSAVSDERNKVKSSDGSKGGGPTKDVSSVSDEIKSVRKNMTKSTNDQLSDDTLTTLLTISDRDFALSSEYVSNAIYDSMSNKIKWNDLDKVQTGAVNSIPATVDSDNLHQAIQDILTSLIVPNYVFDAEGTKKSKTDAASAVDPVVIHQGEVIVKKGELITADVMRKLKAVGLLDDHFNIYPFLGLAILVGFLTTIVVLELRPINNKKKAANLLLVHFCLFLMTIIFLKLDALLLNTHITGIELIVPVSAGPLLMAILIHKRIAASSSIAFAVCAGFIFGATTGNAGIFDFQMALYVLFSSLAGAMVLRGNYARPRIIQTGLIISLVNVLSILSLMMIKNGGFHANALGIQVGYAILSGFISTILTLGMLPFFETLFGILSTLRLIELSNPNHPLLKKILMEAPGTYHHSIMVANLAERASEAIGANGLLARVAAYYHDIGKTKRPHFFIENQLNEVNPHDKISPQLSKTIIIAHPYDGAKVLKEYRLPQEIIDICEQHHGTTLLKFFYHKAQEELGQEINEIEFRYPGPKVQTKEAAVVELADSVEAAVRSLKKPNPVKIENLVKNIFNDRLQDGQFDECDITLHELHLVQKSICETLNGIFHSRIEYPTDLDKKAVSE